jgi:hypothetical protein
MSYSQLLKYAPETSRVTSGIVSRNWQVIKMKMYFLCTGILGQCDKNRQTGAEYIFEIRVFQGQDNTLINSVQ